MGHEKLLYSGAKDRTRKELKYRKDIMDS